MKKKSVKLDRRMVRRLPFNASVKVKAGCWPTKWKGDTYDSNSTFKVEIEGAA